MNRKPEVNYRLYLVADKVILGDRDFPASIEQAVLGGVNVVQLREKHASSRDLYHLAKKMKELTDKYHIPLIINDRLDIALAVDAAGIHLGQQDLPACVARRILGPNKILGVSAATVEEAVRAENEGADYLGVGAVFPTTSKHNTRKVSFDLLKAIKNAVNIPVVAIGGINQHNVKPVLETGVDGIAVISAVLGQADIQNAAEELSRLIESKIG